jgi:DNA-binding GntR family transcriptional regulator
MLRVSVPRDVPALTRRVLADDVFETLTALVMDHVVAPGERMSIDGLAARLGVSPTPVRESLARLEALGLASKEPLRGYRATPLLTRAELDDLFEFRLLLEPWAAGRAARAVRRGDADATGLTRLLEEMTEAPSAGYDHYRALTEHDRRFHDAVLAMAGNDHSRQAFERTNCHLHIFRLHYVQQVGSSAIAEHAEVAESVRAGAAREAEAAMRAHLRAARDRLRPVASH